MSSLSARHFHDEEAAMALGFNDADRADKLLAGVVGKRLTYQTSCGKA